MVGFGKDKKDYLVSLVKEESKKMVMQYDLTKDLEKNDIDNEYKLYEYLFNNMNPKLSIFSSIYNLRKAISINNVSTLVLASFNKLTLINGDYDGFIFDVNKTKSVKIIHNNNVYFITIYSGEYFNENLYDLLSTISFE